MSKTNTVVKAIKMGCKHGGKFLAKNAPTGLCIIGTVGVVAALILAVEKAPDAQAELKKEKAIWEATPDKDKRNKADYIFKLVRIGTQHYWVVIAVATGAVVCFWLANHISIKRLKSALLAAGLATKSKEELEEKIKELDGEKHLSKLKEEVAVDQLRKADDIDFSKEYGPGESWFYEPGSRQYFRSNYERIRQSCNAVREDLESQIIDDGCKYAWVPANDFLLDIGCEMCDFGNSLGFGVEIISNDISRDEIRNLCQDACAIKFGSDFKNGVPCGVLIYDCRLQHNLEFNVCEHC